MRGVCVKCGEIRSDWRGLCPTCGFRPSDEGVLVAWLLSDEHLDAGDLQAAADRVKSGQSVWPSERLIEKARQALGQTLSSDPGLDYPTRLGILLSSLFLTPLVGLTLWWWWRASRPKAALQALVLSAPISALLFAVVLWHGLLGR